MQERLFNERNTGAKEAHGASPVLEKVIYSCKCSGCAGFTNYALCVYHPRSMRAWAVVASWRAELLRQRMETLQLDLAEVKRIEWDVFRELAEACAGCESKAECEKDPAIAPGAEGTCVNATTFRALEALPWFKPKSPRVPCSAAW